MRGHGGGSLKGGKIYGTVHRVPVADSRRGADGNASMHNDVATFGLAGAALGLSAGFSPGPLLSLVLTQSMVHGTREGVKVALAPLVTDAPILLLAWLVLSRLEGRSTALGLVALAGACVLVRYAWDCFVPPAPDSAGAGPAPRSLGRGIVANLLNPHPYLFWLTVGMPTLMEAATVGTAAVVLFVAVFYMAIVGAKVLTAVLAGRFRRFLASTAYRLLMAGLGCSLLVFAAMFARQGFSMIF
jgi:threonine/homoserine/homoserine lactone efflux protein